MSSQCLMSLNFNHNSFVGLDQNEIENCTLEDLKYLRKEIKRYLMKIGLKKRNRNFVEVFLRINKEIKRRKLGYPNIFQVAKTKYDPSSSINEDPTEDSSRKNSYINIPSCNTPFHDPKESETRDELVIPEFFNDKCTSPTKALSGN